MTAPDGVAAGARDPAGRLGPVVVVLQASTPPEDIPALCEGARRLMAGGDVDLVCDVSAIGQPDMALVAALARLQLTVRRLGRRMRLRGATPALRQLLGLAGLAGVLGVEPWGEPEDREEMLGVEEGVQPDDPPL